MDKAITRSYGVCLEDPSSSTEKRNLRAPDRDTDAVVRMATSTVISGLFTVAITGYEAKRG